MSPDNVTRSTRLAANAAAMAVVAYAALWAATTQVAEIRAVSPFGDDPWDAIASYAAIFLPLVAGATWIRSIRHRGPILPAVTAGRIRWGAGLAAGIVLASVGADLLAIRVSTQSAADAGDLRPTLIVLAVTLAGVMGAIAAGLLVRAELIARRAGATRTDRANVSPEPDIVDDLLALASDVARPINLERPIGRMSDEIERFLDHSPISPRRHRIGFGVVLAAVAAVGFDAWHSLIEGGVGSPAVLVVFGALTGIGVLGVYLGTVVPLRLLRPVTDRNHHA